MACCPARTTPTDSCARRADGTQCAHRAALRPAPQRQPARVGAWLGGAPLPHADAGRGGCGATGFWQPYAAPTSRYASSATGSRCCTRSRTLGFAGAMCGLRGAGLQQPARMCMHTQALTRPPQPCRHSAGCRARRACARWMPVTVTGAKPPRCVGPSSRRCPTRTAPATTVPATTLPTPATSKLWSTCGPSECSGAGWQQDRMSLGSYSFRQPPPGSCTAAAVSVSIATLPVAACASDATNSNARRSRGRSKLSVQHRHLQTQMAHTRNSCSWRNREPRQPATGPACAEQAPGRAWKCAGAAASAPAAVTPGEPAQPAAAGPCGAVAAKQGADASQAAAAHGSSAPSLLSKPSQPPAAGAGRGRAWAASAHALAGSPPPPPPAWLAPRSLPHEGGGRRRLAAGRAQAGRRRGRGGWRAWRPRAAAARGRHSQRARERAPALRRWRRARLAAGAPRVRSRLHSLGAD